MKNLISKGRNTKKASIISISLLVLIAAFSYVTFEATKKTVAVTLDGEGQTIKTHASTVEEVLAQLDISIRSEDNVNPALPTKIEDNIEVVWEPAKQVQLVKENEEKLIWTTAKTVDQLLREQSIVLKEYDFVTPERTKSIEKEMVVQIEFAFPLTIVDGGKEQKTWSTATTVAEFLEKEAIELSELDRVTPALEDTLKEDAVVDVVRVEKVTDIVEEQVDFAVVTKKDANLTKGTEKVVNKGEKGLLKKEFEVVLENGEEVSRELVKENKIKNAQDKVVAVGTKVIKSQVSRGTQTPSGSGKEFYVTATAYTPQCNGCSGITATGVNVAANPHMKLIAVDPRVIPLGTKVYVEGYGNAIAADTGGAIKGNRIDVLFPTKADAYRWGRKQVKIKIL